MADNDRSSSWFRSIPRAAWGAALLAAILHMAPSWWLQHETPAGWTFTGNRSGSPDTMQYRVWMRQAPEEGLFVSNRFTTEPNKPHLAVPLYYATGTLARLTDIPPEWVFEIAGAVFAFLLTIGIFITVQTFSQSSYQTWWIFGVLMLGGGLGGHLNYLAEMSWARNIALIKLTLIDGLQWPTFEDYRSHYIFRTLLDSHFTFMWLFAVLSVLALHRTISQFSPLRLTATSALFAATTFVHLFEGVTLTAIAAGVAFVCWRKQIAVRNAVVSLIATTLATTLTLGWLVFVSQSSGLELPAWRAVNILFATLLIAYPLAWGVIAWGIASYWKNADLDGCFLLGWALGCSALTLSGPFYPYPDRGTMTLQIPLYLIAGAIYFARFKRVSAVAAIVIVVILAASPAWYVRGLRSTMRFRPTTPHLHINADHRRMIDALKQRATKTDALLVDKTRPEWRTDDLWLAPEYVGLHYCGHALTVDYDRKRREVTRFYHELAVDEQAAFLAKNNIRFVFVGPELNRTKFDTIPGLRLVEASTVGILYEYAGNADGDSPRTQASRITWNGT